MQAQVENFLLINQFCNIFENFGLNLHVDFWYEIWVPFHLDYDSLSQLSNMMKMSTVEYLIIKSDFE